mmetsp:Transcript_1619/g.2425  ORF Transcript_1619/g.2425 Transcript_1619/m.2425 type:complete len:86 (-) Transcript_1619:419-676(-)
MGRRNRVSYLEQDNLSAYSKKLVKHQKNVIRITDSCFDACATRFAKPLLTNGEIKCMKNCFQNYYDAYYIASKVSFNEMKKSKTF